MALGNFNLAYFARNNVFFLNEYIQTVKDSTTFRQTKLQKPLFIELLHSKLMCSEEFAQRLKNMGLSVKFHENSIEVLGIPTCIYKSKFKNNINEKKIIDLLNNFIVEEVDYFLKNKYFAKTPSRFLLETINTEACRGAIKFGDSLTVKECKQLINNLSYCDFPFQCAHGRPTLLPLLRLNRIFSQKVCGANLRNLSDNF